MGLRPCRGKSSRGKPPYPTRGAMGRLQCNALHIVQTNNMERIMKVITLLNEKGGVGKTTLAVHIAQGMALRGLRVMLIDSDPQANATLRCRLPRQGGLYDLLIRDMEWANVAKVIDPVGYGIAGERVPRDARLYVVPGNAETQSIATQLGDLTRFAERLDDLAQTGMVDLVVIDTPPTPSMLHASIYTATDVILYPSHMVFTSVDGLVQSVKRTQGASKQRSKRFSLPPIEIGGIIPTMYRGRTNEQRSMLDQVKGHFGAKVWRPMPMRTIWTETESHACPVWTLEPYGDAAADAWELLDQVMEVIGVTA